MREFRNRGVCDQDAPGAPVAPVASITLVGMSNSYHNAKGPQHNMTSSYPVSYCPARTPAPLFTHNLPDIPGPSHAFIIPTHAPVLPHPASIAAESRFLHHCSPSSGSQTLHAPVPSGLFLSRLPGPVASSSSHVNVGGSSSHIEDVVMPLLPSVSLVNRPQAGSSPSTSDDRRGSDNEVSLVLDPEIVGPVKGRHLIWNATCNLDIHDFTVPVSGLIDDGSHLVLIRPDIIRKVGLTVRKLKVPIHATPAWSSDILYFSEFVIVHLNSLSNVWNSKLSIALLCNNLCTEILIGLPFLEHNHIVIDPAA